MDNTGLLIELTRRYTEPHRRYHDLRHIADMLCKGEALALSDEQVMAVWFHDAVYVPGSKTNEADSAKLAVEKLTAAGWDSARVEVVEQIVLDTCGHLPSIKESEKVLDLDLSTLGGSWESYERNGRNIREEFAGVSDKDWNEGRGAWLEGMISRERLFWTPWGEPLETEARANLQRDLDLLRSGQ
jgi:predicted metal-dependent HD superfamily phosphohydrolase